MKKTLTISAASLALAAMPVVGVFATAQTVTVTDTLSAKITSACVFKRYGEAGSANQGAGSDVTPTWDGPTTANAADNDDDLTGSPVTYHKYSATFKPGDDITLGTSTFTGYCNDAGGFTVTVATPDLETDDATPLTIPFAGTAPDSTTGEGWTLAKSGSGGLVTATGATFMDGTSGPTASDTALTETATYKVYTKTATKAGTYTGDVVYTFAYDDPTV